MKVSSLRERHGQRVTLRAHTCHTVVFLMMFHDSHEFVICFQLHVFHMHADAGLLEIAFKMSARI